MHDEESAVASLRAQKYRVIRGAPEDVAARMRVYLDAVGLAKDILASGDKALECVTVSLLEADALVGDRDPRAPHGEQRVFISDAPQRRAPPSRHGVNPVRLA